jgi:hypothetical protein
VIDYAILLSFGVGVVLAFIALRLLGMLNK